jgi:hypothetical protein
MNCMVAGRLARHSDGLVNYNAGCASSMRVLAVLEATTGCCAVLLLVQ